MNLEVLPPVTCDGSDVIHSTKRAKRSGGCVHFTDFDLGFKNREKMLNTVPVELDLLELDEIQRVLANCNQLVYWHAEWEFR